ncbi:MAG: pilus assembly protein N-terminal domain-containing protein [Pseudomonadota bacterium]|nr:pilus assembly protein N-terminal domain-containing protein [Burkholderiaceae bacterium]MDQ3446084.1 pilus assembly protein N-terminal domain-containing protein [Pseudomonadota bacterium]
MSARRVTVVNVVLAAAWVVCASGVSAQTSRGKAAAPPPPVIDEVPAELELFVGETRVLPSPKVARIAVGNGRVLSASVVDERDILLIANDAGATMIHTWASDGRTRRYNVQVRPADMSRTTREILEFLSGSNNVKARAVGDRVLVEGQNLTDEQLFRIDELAKRYTQIVNFTTRVGWEKMILMDVKVVEFKKEKLRELGVRWDTGAPGFNAGVAGDIIRGGFVVNPPTGTGGIQGVETLPRPIDPFRWYFGIVSAISSRLNLFEREGDAIVLATPQLTARSGSSAKFQAGGEIPYSVVNQNGFVTVQFKNYGIILEVKPRADSTGAIRSEILAEVSEPDASVSTLQGVPGLRTRRTQTEFNVRAGETMVLSGLLDRRTGATYERVPGLGRIPILGQLFQSKRFADGETELVIFVTPAIVTAQDSPLNARGGAVDDKVQKYIAPPPEGAFEPVSSNVIKDDVNTSAVAARAGAVLR